MPQVMSRAARLFAVAVFVSGLSVSAYGQVAPPAGPSIASEPQGLAVQKSGPRRPLSVDDAVALALEQNLNLRVERLNPQIRDIAVAQARTAWTPTVGTSFSNQNSNYPAGSILEGSTTKLTQDNFSTRVGAEQQVFWGGRYSVTWDSSRSETNQAFRQVNPTLGSSVNLSYMQPLLRNFRIDGARQQLLVSKNNREMSDVDLQRAVLNTVRSVKNAYWDLSAASSQLEVARQTLELARESLKNNRARVEIGTMAPIDIVEAEAEFAQREEGVIVAEAAVDQAQDRLRALIFDPSMSDFWNVQIELTERPTFEARAIDIEAAIAAALDQRTDLRQQRLSLETSDISIRYYRNQTLPEVNLNANYRLAGQGGTALEYDGPFGPVVGQTRIGYGSVLRQIFANDFPTWSLSLSVGYPIGTSAAQANVARARVERSQADLRLRSLELQVATQIRDLGRQVNTNLKRVEATRASRQLYERRLEAEQKKFAAGMSTSFFVLQAQRDLAQARNAEVRAILDYNKSLVDFEAAQETSLGGSGIVIS
jgi:outer membrane protein